VALVTLMENEFISEAVPAQTLKTDMNKAGFTDIAVSLAVKSLLLKLMVEAHQLESDYGNRYTVYTVAPKGEEWLLANHGTAGLMRPPVCRS